MKQHNLVLERLSNVPWFKLWDWLVGDRLRILLYHSISTSPRDPHATPPEIFRKQMETISLDEYKVVSLTDGLHLMEEGTSLRKTVVLTFDDGYRDFHREAMPVLEEFGFPATIFIPTALVGKHAVWDSHDQAKQLMNWKEIEDVTARGFTFGSHSTNHRRLTECENGELEHELSSSMESLKERYVNALPVLAYPGGYVSNHVILAAKKTGYKYGLGGVSRWGNGPETDPYRLRRVRF